MFGFLAKILDPDKDLFNQVEKEYDLKNRNSEELSSQRKEIFIQRLSFLGKELSCSIVSCKTDYHSSLFLSKIKVEIFYKILCKTLFNIKKPIFLPLLTSIDFENNEINEIVKLEDCDYENYHLYLEYFSVKNESQPFTDLYFDRNTYNYNIAQITSSDIIPSLSEIKELFDRELMFFLSQYTDISIDDFYVEKIEVINIKGFLTFRFYDNYPEFVISSDNVIDVECNESLFKNYFNDSKYQYICEQIDQFFYDHRVYKEIGKEKNIPVFLSDKIQDNKLILEYELPVGLPAKNIIDSQKELKSFIKRDILNIQEIGANEKIQITILLAEIPVTQKQTEKYNIPIGKDIKTGEIVSLDFHKLETGSAIIVGKSGSGKTSLITQFILSAINQNPDPSLMKFICIDPKEELAFLDDYQSRHLLFEVVTDLKKINSILDWILQEGDRRRHIINRKYGRFEDCLIYQRKKQEGDERLKNAEHLPVLFVIFDEFFRAYSGQDMAGKGILLRKMAQIIQFSRSVGIYSITMSQKLADISEADLQTQASYNICLKVNSNRESINLLGDTNTDGVKLKTGQGIVKNEDGVNYFAWEKFDPIENIEDEKYMKQTIDLAKEYQADYKPLDIDTITNLKTP